MKPVKKLRADESRGDKYFDAGNNALMLVTLVSVLYPLYFLFIASISNPEAVNFGKVLLLPSGFNLEGYTRIFNDAMIWTGYRNTVFYASLGTAINVSLTITAGYALSRKDLAGRDIIMGIVTFTMFFSGGLIPLYIQVKQLGMLNTVWAMVLPNAVSVWNLIIARTYFQTNIPEELLEASYIDGCTNHKFFVKIALPLSQALIAVMVMFYAVGHWNAFFDALIYLKSRKLYPLQLVLRDILISNQMQNSMIDDVSQIREMQRLGELIKYGMIIASSLPMLILYPFLQKYFVKGVMVGSLKG